MDEAPDKIRNDSEIVTAAIHSFPLALQYASEAIKDDLKIVSTTTSLEPSSLKYASKKYAPIVTSCFVQWNGKCLLFAPYAMLSDPFMIEAAFETYPGITKHVPGDLNFGWDFYKGRQKRSKRPLGANKTMKPILRQNHKRGKYLPSLDRGIDITTVFTQLCPIAR